MIDPSVFAALPLDIQQELLSASDACEPASETDAHDTDAWSCRVCTFLNHPQLAECEMCGVLCVPLDSTPQDAAQDAGRTGSRIGRTLRRIKVPSTPAAVTFSQKREPTAEDLLVAASSSLQAVKTSWVGRRASWTGRRSRANSDRTGAVLPSQQALQELTELQKNLTLKVEAGDEWLEASLEKLWRAVQDGEQTQDFCRTRVDWVALGFQNASPETDFRGGGVLALKCLLYAFEAHPQEMRAIQQAQTPGQDKKWYPVCVAGINLTCLLAGLLQLGDGRFSDAKQVFWELFEEPAAFYELFFFAFLKMDAIWHRLNATYMEFGVVLKVTRKSVAFILEQAPASLMDLRIASDQAFLDRFVVSLSARSLADWEEGECPDPNHALETEDVLVIAKTRAAPKSAGATKGDAFWPLR